jgi:hypothetical protein
LSGQVDAITYLGAIVRIRLNMDKTTFSMDLFNERKLTLPQIIDQFEFHFPARACWVI